jgi:DNA-binding CsgD family transcriptional regulator
VDESEAFSQSIERLYDAVVDPTKWSAALESISGFVGGGAANLFWQDAATNEVAVFHSWNENPYYTQLYFDKYASLNPYFPALAFAEVGRVVAGADLIPHDEFRQTRFYLEWVKPQNFIDVIGANLERTATSTSFFSIRRHENHGIVDDTTRRRCQLIVPHVKRAVCIGKIIENGRTQGRLLESALERMSSAAMVVTETGKIIFTNRKAEEYLQQKTAICAQQGIVCAVNCAADRTLKDAFAAAAHGDAALGFKGIEVPLSIGNKQSYVAHVLSLASEARWEPSTGGVAALFVNEVTPVSPSPLETIAANYCLTASEIRVLSAVLEEGGVREIGERLGISPATVKTHLNRIFAKTGARRQADLVRLAAKQTDTV